MNIVSPKIFIGFVLATILMITVVATTNASSSQPARGTTTYTVKRGDTLSKIARRYGTTVAAIKRANGLRSSVIRPGQRLRIPKKSTSASAKKCGARYRVKRGDTLTKISRKCGVSVKRLLKLNRLKRASQIRSGQVLRLRGSTTSKKSTPRKTPTPSPVQSIATEQVSSGARANTRPLTLPTPTLAPRVSH